MSVSTRSTIRNGASWKVVGAAPQPMGKAKLVKSIDTKDVDEVDEAEDRKAGTKPSFQLRVFKVFTKFMFITGVFISLLLMIQIVIPWTAAFIAQQGRVTPGASFDEMIVAWLLPLVFVSGVLLWAEIVGIKSFWRWIRRTEAKAATWPLMQRYGAAEKTPTKTGRSRFGRRTPAIDDDAA